MKIKFDPSIMRDLLTRCARPAVSPAQAADSPSGVAGSSEGTSSPWATAAAEPALFAAGLFVGL